jgi:hypothetical protein
MVIIDSIVNPVEEVAKNEEKVINESVKEEKEKESEKEVTKEEASKESAVEKKTTPKETPKTVSHGVKATVTHAVDGDTIEINVNGKNEEVRMLLLDTPEPEPAPVTESFQNCTELRKVYPNGVPAGHPAYAPKHDRYKDNYACER